MDAIDCHTVPYRIAALVLVALLAGCGAETKTGSNGTGRAPDSPEPSVASGPLNGLGPLEVGGATLDESVTSVLINTTLRSSTADLRLGMTANANGNASLTTATGTASGAVAQSIVVAPVAQVDAAAKTISILTLTFRIDQNTLFDGVASLADIVVGDEVEAFGLALISNQQYQATRIVVHRPGGSGRVELLGVLGTPGTVSAGGLINVQGVPVNTSRAVLSVTSPTGVTPSSAAISTLSTGALVRIAGTYDASIGGINATNVISSLAPARAEGDVVFVDGIVREVSSATRFRVADVEVDSAGVTLFPGSVTTGSRIKIRGKFRGGVLRAEQAEQVNALSNIEYSLEGTVSNYSTLSSLQVRGERVDASQAAFRNGTASNLANGRQVRVKGLAGAGVLTAREVTILN